MKKELVRKKYIDFLLENWDYLNMKDIKKIYAKRVVC